MTDASDDAMTLMTMAPGLPGVRGGPGIQENSPERGASEYPGNIGCVYKGTFVYVRPVPGMGFRGLANPPRAVW